MPATISQQVACPIRTRRARALGRHPHWSVFWDKRQCLWRAAEDDPDSELYTESPDADAVMGYITAHS